MFSKKGVRKFLFRWMVVNVVFLLIKLSVEHGQGEEGTFFEPTPIFYYLTAFLFFMVAWEYNDRLIYKQLERGGLDFKNSLIIFGKTMAVLVPMTAIIYYVALFPLRETIGIVCEDPVLEFRGNVLRAWLLGFAVIFVNLFYFTMKQKDELTRQMEDLKREMMVSQYAMLKNQISPHFLFNSLNTLTSLMYEDRDLASDFVTRLASSYRYILDNRERDLVTLQKELGFLDSFIFMMNVRHKQAVQIQLEIKVNPEKYVIPTLSLQMLVENALKHNRYSKEKPLKVVISSIQNDALAIKNNLQKRELKNGTTQLGIKNIKRRYAFYTNKQVLVREETDHFEVIIPLLDESITKMNLKAIS
ncbi:histidine kinase [Muricauda sp. SCSIO 64092]|uniref:sensor histidine kinase n=1 Tax=Allomuricauda sp. SCSIO 64092 TaxID=2908842 RepID=UPI001FF0F0EB|nr:histidine kinase [Muricauda sp. SCSIO 64092]UOY04730.1 histidine kinase [Muricauda sp. SCSIO 64092]